METVNKNRGFKALWIARTALFLAVAVISQIAGTMLGGAGGAGQIITGSIVNMSLILSGITAGISSGCTIAVLSPLLAFLFGVMKFPPVIPIVIAGNLVIVLLSFLAYSRLERSTKSGLTKKFFEAAAIILCACVKCAVMWLSALFILPLYVENVPPAITAGFSLPQAVTGAIGGILAVMAAPALMKAKEN